VFNSKSYPQRVYMYDTLSDKRKPAYYPQIRDSLEVIRAKAYTDHKFNIINQLNRADGIRLYYDHQYSSAIPLLMGCLNADRRLNDIDSLRILFCLKNSYLKIKSYSKALEVNKIMARYEKRKATYNRWWFHPKLSTIYSELKVYGEAIRQNRLEFKEQDYKADADYFNFYNNAGVFFYKAHNPDSALAQFLLARKYAERIVQKGDRGQFARGLVNGNIGQVYKEMHRYREAVPLLQEDIYWSLAENHPDNAANSYNELSECCIHMGRYMLASRYLDSAHALIGQMEDMNLYLNNLRLYGLLHEKSGDMHGALGYYKAYIRSTDSIDAAERRKEVISQQVALQMEEKENIIRRKQYIIDREEENSRHQATVRRMLFAGLLFLLGVLLIVLYLYRRTNRQRQQLEYKNNEIRQQNARIEKSLQEKEFLVREVHHRVKNNLQIISSLLNLQLGMNSNADVKDALSEAYGRISSISLVHQLLYRDKELVDISVKEYFDNLLGQLEQSFSPGQHSIVLRRSIQDVQMDLDRAIPLGLIINETVSNAYKHAFPNRDGEIEVAFTTTAEGYELRISDNGIGLAKSFDAEYDDSFGLEIIKILTDQINGRIRFDNSKGVSYTIRFS